MARLIAYILVIYVNIRTYIFKRDGPLRMQLTYYSEKNGNTLLQQSKKSSKPDAETLIRMYTKAYLSKIKLSIEMKKDRSSELDNLELAILLSVSEVLPWLMLGSEMGFHPKNQLSFLAKIFDFMMLQLEQHFLEKHLTKYPLITPKPSESVIVPKNLVKQSPFNQSLFAFIHYSNHLENAARFRFYLLFLALIFPLKKNREVNNKDVPLIAIKHFSELPDKVGVSKISLPIAQKNSQKILEPQKNILQRFEEHIKRQHEKADKPIIIRDLVAHAYGSMGSYGESDNTHLNFNKQRPFVRLKDHLAFLFKLAKAQHEMDITTEEKLHKAELITRLSTAEFSLYTKMPLDQIWFDDLLRFIEKQARQLPENVHLLLSSFSLLLVDNKLSNVTLYVEGGFEPVIHLIHKGNASRIDVNYDKKFQLFSQLPILSRPQHTSAIIASNDGLVVNTDNFFSVTTREGNKFFQAIDVCIDHQHGRAKHRFFDLVERHNHSVHLPKYVEHVLTSNTTNKNNSNSPAQFILHVDPVESRWINKRAIRPNERLSESVFATLIDKENYPNMSIEQDEGGYKITRPCFSSDFYIKLCAIRKVETYDWYYRGMRHTHNEAALNYRKQNHAFSKSESSEAIAINDIEYSSWSMSLD